MNSPCTRFLLHTIGVLAMLFVASWIVFTFTSTPEIGTTSWTIGGVYLGSWFAANVRSQDNLVLRWIWMAMGSVAFGLVGYWIEEPPFTELAQVVRSLIWAALFGWWFLKGLAGVSEEHLNNHQDDDSAAS